MANSSNHGAGSLSRRAVLQRLAGSAFLTAASPFVRATAPAAPESAAIPSEPLISVWEHSAQVDIAPIVKEVGFNTVWTHDKPYSGQKLEETLMYTHMRTPGIKYVIAKIERGIWGWKFDQAMAHAEWIAGLSLTREEIIGLYLNDFMEEMEEVGKGGHSEKEFRQIIAKAKCINPGLPIWVPCYPPHELEKAYDFDIDAIIFSFYNTQVLQDHARLLDQALKKFQGKPLMGSLYLNAGSERRWLSQEEVKQLLNFFVQGINEGKLCGLRIFRAENLRQRPEYMAWTKEALANLKRA
ncbi:MAG: hypothetical protein HXY20_12780 [Acidobacteria bacterium]|nr:hypothetical protein [Acidobacteriota bacterium]